MAATIRLRQPVVELVAEHRARVAPPRLPWRGEQQRVTLSSLLTSQLGRQRAPRGDESVVARYKTTFNLDDSSDAFGDWLAVIVQDFCTVAKPSKSATWTVGCDSEARTLTLTGHVVLDDTPCEPPLLDTVESSETMVAVAQALLQPEFVPQFDCPTCRVHQFVQTNIVARDATLRHVRLRCRHFRDAMRDAKLSDDERHHCNVRVYYDDECALISIEARWCEC